MGPKRVIVFPTNHNQPDHVAMVDPFTVRALAAMGSGTYLHVGEREPIFVDMAIRQVADALGWSEGAVMAADTKQKWST